MGAAKFHCLGRTPGRQHNALSEGTTPVPGRTAAHLKSCLPPQWYPPKDRVLPRRKISPLVPVPHRPVPPASKQPFCQPGPAAPPFMPAKRVQFLFTGGQHIADRQNSLAKCGSNVPCQGTGIKENARPSSVKTLQARKDLRPLLPQKIVSRYPRPRRLAQSTASAKSAGKESSTPFRVKKVRSPFGSEKTKQLPVSPSVSKMNR